MPDERGLWSDYSGTIEYGPKEELPAPKGYHWLEDNWKLDETGPWIDEQLGLGMYSLIISHSFNQVFFFFA